MRDTVTLISEYLYRKTNYAFQIAGEWGNGKTHNFRNVVVPKIIKTKCNHNDEKSYIPVYISLFGMKSIDDISTRIVSEFYGQKIFKKYFRGVFRKRLKIANNILKIGVRGFLNLKTLGNLSDYDFDIKALGVELLELEELVLCFDDLERKDPSLNIDEFCGYINSLIDDGIKVILIYNENILLKEQGNYKVLKEKIIGITSEFIPNVELTLRSIIFDRYSCSKVYTEFLIENFELLLKFTLSINNNFRHVIYSLDNLHLIYSELRKGIFDTDHNISSHLKNHIESLSYQILFFSTEYKSTELNYKDINKYHHDQSLSSLLERHIRKNAKAENKEERIQTDYEKLILKYKISESEYKLYRTIFNFVTGYNDFNLDEFIKEYTDIHKLNEGELPPLYEVLYSLDYRTCFSLSDKEYKDNTHAALAYAETGLYSPIDYISLMHYSERFDNVLNLNLEETEMRLIRGLKLSIQNAIPAIDLLQNQFEMSGRSSNLSEHLKSIFDVGLKEFDLAENTVQKLKSASTLKDILANIDHFPLKMKNDEKFNSLVRFQPVFMDVDVAEFIESIFNASNETLNYLNTFFDSRYDRQSDHIEELNSIIAIKNALIKSIESLEDSFSIKVYLIKALISKLGKAEKNIV